MQFVSGNAQVHAAIDRAKLPESYDELDGDELILRLAIDGRIGPAKTVLREAGFKNKDEYFALHAQALLADERGDATEALNFLVRAIEKAKSKNERLAAARDHVRIALQAKRRSDCEFGIRFLLSNSSQMSPLDHRQVAVCYSLSGRAGELRAIGYLDQLLAKKEEIRFHPLILSERVRIWSALGMLNVAERELLSATSRKELRSEISGLVLDFLEKAQTLKLGRPPFGNQLLVQTIHSVTANDRESLLSFEAQRMFVQGQKVMTAMRFEQLARENRGEATASAVVASEIYQLMGWRYTANRIAMSIEEPKARLKLIGSDYLESGMMGKVAALFPSLDRSLFGGELADERTQDWIYLGAFARLQSGGWSELGQNSPVSWLRHLKSPVYRDKAVALRNLAEDCRIGGDQICEL